MENKKKGNLFNKRVWGLLKPYVWLLIVSVVFSIVNTFFNSMLPQVFRYAVDVVIGNDAAATPDWVRWLRLPPFEKPVLLWGSAGTVLLLAVLAGLCGYVSGMATVKAADSFIKDLRDKLFHHVQRIRFSWHSSHKTGDVIQRCTSDVDVIRNFLSGQLMEVFRIIVLIILSLFMMFSMDYGLTFVAFAFIPIVVGYSMFFYKRIGKEFKKADEAEGDLSSTVQENLTGVRVVRAFGRERYEVSQFDVKNDIYASLWLKLGRSLGYFWSTGDFFTGLQIMLIITLGAGAAVDGRITLGEYLAFISYNAALVWPVRALGRILSDMSKTGVSVERVSYILNAPEEDNFAGEKPPMNKDIVFSHVSYQYEDDMEKEVLKDIDFTIPVGKTYGILGETGSGKSTLIHLLARLYELPEGSGKITVGGVDIKKINKPYLRKNLGIVLQEPFLFSRTVEENIKAAAPEAGLDDIRYYAQIACVDDALNSFTHGYQTMVGERGVTLSGGQKQRVAIARMLMQEAPIMIFDDSLSAVDSETDSKIREALKENLGQSTVILISHRITTLMHADVIVVLENGELAEMGSHKELLQKKGIYKSIYDIQMRR